MLLQYNNVFFLESVCLCVGLREGPRYFCLYDSSRWTVARADDCHRKYQCDKGRRVT